MVAIGARAPGRRRDHRRHAAPGRPGRVRQRVPRPDLRRRHRRAARGDVGRRPGHRRPAPGRRGLRDLPQPGLRPGADGRARCTGPVSPSCWTAPASPAPTAPRTTACGTCRSCRSSPACGSPPRATPTRCARQLREAVDVDDAPTVVRFPKGAVAGRPAGARAGRRSLDVLHGRHGPGRRAARRRRRDGPDLPGRRRALPRAGHQRHRRRPALGEAGQRRPVEAARPPGRWRWSRTTVGSAASARRWRWRCGRPGSTCRCTFGIPQEFLEHASRSQILEQVGLTADSIATSLAAALPR